MKVRQKVSDLMDGFGALTKADFCAALIPVLGLLVHPADSRKRIPMKIMSGTTNLVYFVALLFALEYNGEQDQANADLINRYGTYRDKKNLVELKELRAQRGHVENDAYYMASLKEYEQRYKNAVDSLKIVQGKIK